MRAAFDCGHPFLNEYLRHFAQQNHGRNLARAYVLVPATGNPVLGYYTLSAAQIAFENIPVTARKGLPKYPVPVARIGELGIDRSIQGQGLGSVLLLDAFERITRAGADLAIRAIVVDPIDQPAARFYEHFGFERLLDSDALFIPMNDVAAWLRKN